MDVTDEAREALLKSGLSATDVDLVIEACGALESYARSNCSSRQVRLMPPGGKRAAKSMRAWLEACKEWLRNRPPVAHNSPVAPRAAKRPRLPVAQKPPPCHATDSSSSDGGGADY